MALGISTLPDVQTNTFFILYNLSCLSNLFVSIAANRHSLQPYHLLILILISRPRRAMIPEARTPSVQQEVVPQEIM